MKANYEDKIPKQMAEVSIGSLYDINKQIVVTLPALSEEKQKETVGSIIDWFQNQPAEKYYTKVVVYLGNSTYGGPWVFRGCFLVDGDSGRKTFYEIHLRLIHLAYKHTRIGGKALNEAAMTLCIQGIECE